MTQVVLAEKIGKVQHQISEWETGTRQSLDFETLATIEDALGVRRGHILRTVGLVVDPGAEEAIESDPRLTPARRAALLAGYRELKRRRR